MTSVRSKEHNIQINQIKQVQKKVNDASKSLVRIEYKDDHIKIKPNSGCFMVISDKVKEMKVGDIIKMDDKTIATVTDQHLQVDRNKVPFIMKTELIVKKVETGSENKAVLHTYITTTFLMIQGKGQEEFFEQIMKPFIEKIMKESYMEIIFINKVLRSMDKTEKRKAAEKTEKCDICGRMFSGIGGLRTHTTRYHKTDLQKTSVGKETVEVLTRTHSIQSESSLSPPPKMIFFAPKPIATAVLIEFAETDSKQKIAMPALGLANDPSPPSQEGELNPSLQVHQLLGGHDLYGEPALVGGHTLVGGPQLTEDLTQTGEPAKTGEPTLAGEATQAGDSAKTGEPALTGELTGEPSKAVELSSAGESTPPLQESSTLLHGEGPGPMERYELEDSKLDKEVISELKTLLP